MAILDHFVLTKALKVSDISHWLSFFYAYLSALRFAADKNEILIVKTFSSILPATFRHERLLFGKIQDDVPVLSSPANTPSL